MMRSNAPISSFLGLAVLFLLPATLLAKPVHHRARRTTTVHRQVSRKTTTEHKRVSSTRLSRVHSSGTRTERHLTRRARARVRASSPRHLDVSDASHRKATAADFLKAADTQPDTRARSRKTLTSRRAERAEAAQHSRTQLRKTRDTAKATPVVNVIRPSRETPQLRSVEEDAATPVILPTLYNKRGRLIVPPPLKGSHEILLHQNEVADREGLDRIQNDADLLAMRDKGMLVSLPADYALEVDDRLPTDRRYCRPWTSRFLSNMARAHYARFHTPLQINSAVRTVEFQQHLIRVNGNAAPAEGDTASPHLTGQAIDIAKHGLSLTEIAWMRGYLLPLTQEGKIDVEEEFQQACFHISVYKKYLPPGDVPRRNVSSRANETAALATAIR